VLYSLKLICSINHRSAMLHSKANDLFSKIYPTLKPYLASYDYNLITEVILNALEAAYLQGRLDQVQGLKYARDPSNHLEKVLNSSV
jgi:hypothetical protein